MKKTLIILGIILVILFLGVLSYFLFVPQDGKEGGLSGVIQKYFPFGAPKTPVSKNSSSTEESGGYPYIDGNHSENGEASSSPLFSQKELRDFILLVESPVSGFQTISGEGDVNTIVRYMDKDRGNIFKTNLSGLKTVRISEDEIKDVHHSIWSKDGNFVIARYLSEDGETVKSYLVDLSGYSETSGYTMEGVFLPGNITSFTPTENSENTFFITNTPEGSRISRLDFANKKTTTLFESPFSEWLIEHSKDGSIFLSTKASQNVPGYLYKLLPGENRLVKILGGIQGLTTLVSPNGNYVLYSQSTRNGLTLFLYDIGSKQSIELSRSTLPEKCVWETSSIFYCAVPKEIPTGEYPDDWYQGSVVFSDSVMKFSVGNPTPTQTFELDSPIDAISLEIEGNYVFFLDRKNSFLWARKIDNVNTVPL